MNNRLAVNGTRKNSENAKATINKPICTPDRYSIVPSFVHTVILRRLVPSNTVVTAVNSFEYDSRKSVASMETELVPKTLATLPE